MCYRLLLSWRSKLRKFVARKLKEEAKHLDEEISLSSSEDENDVEKPRKKKKEEVVDKDDDEDEETEKQLAELKAEEIAELKRYVNNILHFVTQNSQVQNMCMS